MLIELQDLGKSFGEHEVLCGVSARVERGDRIGIIGANGTGKTTLLRILCGESQPDAGTAAFASNLTVGYLEQAGRLEPDKDVYETMRLAFAPALAALAEQETLQKRLATATETERPGIEAAIAHDMAVIDAMDAYNMDTQIKKVLSGMGFPADTWQKKAGVLSGGEQTRLRLARLLLERPDILILDEPTNHLDLETMEWLETYLKTYRGAVLVVSHDRYFLDAVCTRIWELAGKTILTYKGNYSAYLPQREAADERQQKLHDAAVEKAAKLQDYIDRNLVRASTTKMAQSRRKQLEKLEIVDAPERQGRELSFRFEYDIEPYDELVILKGLSIRIGTRTLLEPLDYTVHRGDKLVIAGPNGAGKSTLLQAGWCGWEPAQSRGSSPSSRPAAPAVSSMLSGTNTPALPSLMSAAIWRGSATAARRFSKTAPRFQAVSWPGCGLRSLRLSARTCCFWTNRPTTWISICGKA